MLAAIVFEKGEFFLERQTPRARGFPQRASMRAVGGLATYYTGKSRDLAMCGQLSRKR